MLLLAITILVSLPASAQKIPVLVLVQSATSEENPSETEQLHALLVYELTRSVDVVTDKTVGVNGLPSPVDFEDLWTINNAPAKLAGYETTADWLKAIPSSASEKTFELSEGVVYRGSVAAELTVMLFDKGNATYDIAYCAGTNDLQAFSSGRAILLSAPCPMNWIRNSRLGEAAQAIAMAFDRTVLGQIRNGWSSRQ